MVIRRDRWEAKRIFEWALPRTMHSLVSFAACASGVLATVCVCIFVGSMSLNNPIILAIILAVAAASLCFVLAAERGKWLVFITLFLSSFYADYPIWHEDTIYSGGARVGRVLLMDIPLVLATFYYAVVKRFPGLRDLLATSVFKIMLFMLLLEIVSTLFAISSTLAIFELMQTVRELIVLAIVFGFVSSKKRLLSSYRFLVSLCLFHSGVALFQFISGGSMGLPYLGELVRRENLEIWADGGSEIYKVSSFLGGPNTFCIFLEMLVPVTLSLYLARGKGAERMYYLIGFIAGLAALFLVFSKAGWLVCLISITVCAMFCGSGGKGRKGMLKYILITGIVLIVISSLWDRYAAIFPDGKRGIGAMGERRLENLTSGLESVLENPVTGIGLNNYAFLFEGSDLIEAHTTLHNYYLLIAAESGIIMLISFMLLLFKLGSAFSEICFAGSQIYRYGCAGIAAGTLGVCVHSLVTWELRQPPNGILFHALIGVVLGAGAVLRGSRSQANVFQQRIKR